MDEVPVDRTLPPMGFISLDIHFNRPPGDAWNEGTWPFPLIRQQAEGSTEPEVVLSEKYDQGFIDRFVAAGEKLAAKGCVGIITSCGFLLMAQPELSARLPIPIATSSLLQVPSALSLLPPTKTLGILTYDAERFSPTHLEQLSLSSAALKRIHVGGAPAGGYLRGLVARGEPYTFEGIRDELVEVAKKMMADQPTIGAIVLECTQMPPFAEAIQEAVGTDVIVYDVSTMARWFYSGLRRKNPKSWNPPA